jgi:serine acetyltransferase/GT2 family glycosyltransferase
MTAAMLDPSATRASVSNGAATAGTPDVSVVIATYERPDSIVRLLGLLAEQTLAADRYEVIVVDDGSRTPVAPRLAELQVPYRLIVETQPNGGPAVARHRGILAASAPVIVVVDDDMRVDADFLEAHLAEHPAGSRRVVLGRLREDSDTPLRLHERFGLRQIDLLAEQAARGKRQVRGTDLYTGNVSFRREDYHEVGGFDFGFRLSEDAELGVRLERHGAEFLISERACARHASDHVSTAKWMSRSVAYGGADTRMSAKHGDPAELQPWRFLFLVSPVSRPFLLASALAPRLMLPVARLALGVAQLLDRGPLRRVAVAGATFVYGICYFVGVGEAAGSARAALGGLRRHLNARPGPDLGFFARVAKCVADVREDHAAIRRSDAKYKAAPRRGSMLGDAVQKIGFQMMVAYRVMRLLRDVRLGILAKIASRAIRNLYGAELHWDAEIAPGVVIVHGTGLILSHAARVGPGCILFQGVTLGESIHPETRESGAPTLEADVHVGPGSTLIGPIVVGARSKVMAGSVLDSSVPPNSLVRPVPVQIVQRERKAGRRAGGGAPDEHG